MKQLIKIVSFLGLALTLLPSVFLFQEVISATLCKQLMALGTVLWFVTSPFWMNKSI
ncbi:hypothetical protein [Pleomorphovibrio marinus]|uniref:hypothetical protein n=1 Tax=Pleomorphovibrio marinus TaxID=2164132 RepID=UPI0018E5A1C9|nr:hypothetical protein [Pleomorphovibrio marinus]